MASSEPTPGGRLRRSPLLASERLMGSSASNAIPKRGRKRRRNGKGSTSAPSGFTDYAFHSTDLRCGRWKVSGLPEFPRAVTHPGFRYKLSSAWIDCPDGRARKYNLPYIDHVGRISNCTMYTWKTTPMRLVATLISTVYKRLMDLMFRRHKKKAFKLKSSLLRLSAYYVFTKNDYLLNRILAITKAKPRRSGRRFNGLLKRFESKLDDNTRFVLAQVWLCQADWFTSGSERPRDKSNRRILGKHRSLLFSEGFVQPDSSFIATILRRVARWATTFWMNGKELSIMEVPPRHVVFQQSQREESFTNVNPPSSFYEEQCKELGFDV